jgi:hypothetical protein
MTPTRPVAQNSIRPDTRTVQVTNGYAMATGAKKTNLPLRKLRTAASTVADDVQWLDQATHDVLAFVSRRLSSDPVGSGGAVGARR